MRIIQSRVKLPQCRFRKFLPGVDSESSRDIVFTDFVEVPSHVVIRGNLTPNPAYKHADFEMAWATNDA